MYTLAVCAEMVYRDLPIEERARRIHEAGFQVEIWDWTRHDLDALAQTPAEFSSMTGYNRGTLTDPDGAAELLRTAEESIKAAEHLGCPRLNLHGTGLDGEGLPVVPVTDEAAVEMWITARSPAWPNWAKARASPSLWRTSTPPSITPVSRSPRPPTPSPWSRQLIGPVCG